MKDTMTNTNVLWPWQWPTSSSPASSSFPYSCCTSNNPYRTPEHPLHRGLISLTKVNFSQTIVTNSNCVGPSSLCHNYSSWKQVTLIFKTVLGSFMNYICFMFWHLQSFTLSVPDVKVPGVVLVVGDVDPVVVGDHPLVQRQDGLVPGLDPSHLWRQTVNKG